MRHRRAGWKLGRNTEHRRALLRNLVTSLIVEERIETTVTKAKAMRPHVEKMITLGKRGDVAARRLAAVVPDDARSRHQAVRHHLAALRRPRGRLPAHHSLPASARAMAGTWPLSSCWAARRRWTRSARSAPRSAPSAPKRAARLWKRRRRRKSNRRRRPNPPRKKKSKSFLKLKQSAPRLRVRFVFAWRQANQYPKRLRRVHPNAPRETRRYAGAGCRDCVCLLNILCYRSDSTANLF